VKNILDTFFSLRLIDGLDGDDTRYSKIKKAAESLAEIYRNHPPKLIQAIISGLNPKVNVSEPSIIEVKECLQEEWKAVETAYSEEPVELYRGIILEACLQVTNEADNASIMWLTASDVLPLLDLGKEKDTLLEFMYCLAETAELKCVTEVQEVAFQKIKPISLGETDKPEASTISKSNQTQLFNSIAGAAGKSYINNSNERKTLDVANRYFPHQHPENWAGDFAKIMSDVLAAEFDRLANNAIANDNKCLEYVSASQASLQKAIEKALNEQRLGLQKQQKEFIKYQKNEQTRLNVLWWSEALYSPSLQNSYRDCEKELIAVLMPYDLLGVVKIPTPASVSYMLSETLFKLPDIEFSTPYGFLEVLSKLNKLKEKFPQTLLGEKALASENKVFNIRDLVRAVLTDPDGNNCDDLIARSVVPKDWKCSLPLLARIIFKQEQAYKLAERGEQDD
jgi:hypothetical protein